MESTLAEMPLDASINQRLTSTASVRGSPARSIFQASQSLSQIRPVAVEPRKPSPPPPSTTMANMLLDRRRVLKILEQKGATNDAKLIDEVLALSSEDLSEIIKEEDQRLAKNAVIFHNVLRSDLALFILN